MTGFLKVGVSMVALAMAGGALAQAGSATNTADQPETGQAPPAPAAANQLAPAATGAGGTAASDTGIADIVVTAERRASSIQRTPIAITAITGNELRERQLNTIGDVLAQTPALVVQNAPNGQAIFIRGIGSTGDSRGGGDPAVNFNIDGVYQQQASIALASTLDVNRVEVLRGPQGTLYGRNSNAGTINVITNDPALGQSSGYANVQLGNYREVRAEAVANVPLGSTVAGRFAFSTERHDGYYSNGGSAPDGYALRGKVKAQLSDPLTVTLTGLWARETGEPASTVPIPSISANPFSTVFPVVGPIRNPNAPLGARDLKLGQVYAQLDYDVGFGTLTILPAYNYVYQYMDTALIPTSDNLLISTERAKSVEARLASAAASSVKWVVGGFFYRGDDYMTPFAVRQAPFNYNPAREILNNRLLDAYARSLAAFGQVTVPLTDALRVTGGARYTADLKGNVYASFSAPSNSAQIAGSQAGQRKNYQSGTFRGGVEYDVSPRSLLYAQVSNGYKAGGFNPPSGPVGYLSYDPEKITAYETGLKNRLFGNHVLFNLGAYYYTYKGYQVRANVPDCTNPTLGQSQEVYNANNVKNYGGEAELTVVPTRHDRLTATAAYLHARGDFVFNNATCFNGVIGNPILVHVDTPPNAPEWSGTLSYVHSFDLPGGATLSARGDMRWSDRYDTSIDPTPLDSQAGFTRTDLALILAAAEDRYAVRLYVRNVENKVQKLYVLAPPFLATTGYVAAQISDPRTYGVAVSARF